MARASDVFLFLLMIVLTAAYCWFISLAMGMFNVFLSAREYTDISHFSVIVSTKPLLWQILALGSLVNNLIVAYIVKKKKSGANPMTSAAACHMAWLFTAFYLHGVGFLLPFLVKAYVIK